MAKKKLLLFRGTDEYAIENRVKVFLNVFDDPTTAQMNTARLDMRKADLNAARDSAFSMPFLASQRYVVLDHAAHPFTGNVGKQTLQQYQQKFIDLLNNLPSSTNLAVIHPEEPKIRQGDKPEIPKYQWLEDWKGLEGESFTVEVFQLPSTPDTKRAWLLKAAENNSLKIQDNAIALLLAFAGDFDPRSLDTELAKLAAYTNYSRAVTVDDVRAVCVTDEVFKIFDLTDAVGAKNYKKAIHIFRRMAAELDTQNEIFPLIVRQYRLLLQVSYLREMEGNVANVSKIGGIGFGYIAKKIVEQASQYTYSSLKNMYAALLELDLAMKLSKVDPDAGLELFILESAGHGEFRSEPILQPRPVLPIDNLQ